MAEMNAEEIFGRIEKDFVKLSQEAARVAANKAQKDIRQRADRFIDEYYQFTPKIYKQRRYALYKLLEDYYQEQATPKGIKIEFGITYNPANIKGMHQSKSRLHQSGSKWLARGTSGFSWNSGNNGVPQPDWITNQFLDGKHPWTQEDKPSPKTKMQEFFDTELEALIGVYMNESLFNAIEKYF